MRRLIRGGGSSALCRGFGGAWEAEDRGEGVLQGTPSSSSDRDIVATCIVQSTMELA